jgi:hypothetical protein
MLSLAPGIACIDDGAAFFNPDEILDIRDLNFILAIINNKIYFQHVK